MKRVLKDSTVFSKKNRIKIFNVRTRLLEITSCIDTFLIKPDLGIKF